MAGPGLDANQSRSRPRLGGLQGSGEFEAVGRENAVVVVACRNQRRRVVNARLEVMIGGIGQEGFELVRVVGRAIVRGPGPPDGEFT